jgi:DNA helicase-2/ATP-dependent DNA helicase PcrA
MSIQYRVEADIDVLQTPLVSSILQLITVFSDPTDSHTLSRVLYIPWIGLDPIDCAHIIKCFSGKRSHDKIYLIDILQNKKELESIGVKNTKDIMLFAQYISDCHRDFHSSEPTILFDTIVQHARFGPYVSLTGETIQESLSLIQVLYENIQSFISSNPNSHLSDYYTSLQTLIKHGKKLTQHIHAGAQGFVRIMTAHKSKGLEFDHVFIPYLVNKHWGNKTNSDSIKILDRVFGITESVDTNSDERRLLYVALTRARLQIHLSYSQTSDSAKEIAPSQFIAELPIENFTVVDTTAIHAEYESACLERYSTVVTASQSNKERFHQYIIELLDSRPLSATHLNNYLADPWQYIFQNLIRVPAMQNASMIYGTAVHRAIETAYTLQQTTGDVDIDSVFAQFRRVLDTSPLSEADHARLSVIGPELITNWISAHVSELKLYGYNELGIRGVIVPGIGLTLSGQIDRLEYINNSQTFVRVIDFKTGKTKTRTDVAGEIKSSDGNYYRQLCFYKLLLDNYRDGMYKMEQGSIAFIEPKSNGEYIEHTFVIPESDIVGLVETIAKMESDLRAGLYWDHIPDPKKCNFVDLVTRLQQ